MRGKTYKATNWVMVGLLLISWQFIIMNYLLPIMVGMQMIPEVDAMMLALTTIVSLLLAYVSGALIRRTFTKDGQKMGRLGL